MKMQYLTCWRKEKIFHTSYFYFRGFKHISLPNYPLLGRLLIGGEFPFLQLGVGGRVVQGWGGGRDGGGGRSWWSAASRKGGPQKLQQSNRHDDAEDEANEGDDTHGVEALHAQKEKLVVEDNGEEAAGEDEEDDGEDDQVRPHVLEQIAHRRLQPLHLDWSGVFVEWDFSICCQCLFSISLVYIKY